MSPTVHMLVGSITLLLFLVNAIMYAVEMLKGRPMPYHRLVSISAATALLLQFALGFMLLGAGHSIRMWHWIVALIAVLPVGWEHMATANNPNFRTKSMIGLIASAAAFILILAAYGMGEMG